MTELPLDKKYRPRSFEDIIGNKSLIESLTSLLESDKKVNSILLQGPSGCGKTTLARIIANHLGAKVSNIKELNISKQGGIDAARNLIDNCKFAALGGGQKVYILNECHGGDPKARTNFQNAMLEVLEEPPNHVNFILCTTEPEKLLKTIKTRCTTFQVSKLNIKELKTQIKNVIVEEGRRRFPQEAIQEIAESADGSPRQALVILDSVINIKDNEKLIEAINDFSVKKEEIINLSRLLLNGNSWKEVAGILNSLDNEPESIRLAVLGFMNSVMLNVKSKEGKQMRASLVINEFNDPFYSGKALLTNACYNVLMEIQDLMKGD